MKLPIFIAKRYLFSQKKKSVINVISWISLVGIAIGAMALIIVLSVYNGIGNLTQSIFNIFDPQLKIEAREGKTFLLTDIPYEELKALPNVESTTCVVEENMWMTYKEQNRIVTMRGVEDNYHKTNGIDSMLYVGKYELKDECSNKYVVMGAGIYYRLGVNPYDAHTPVGVHIPKRTGNLGFSFENAFNSAYVLPTGNFRIQGDVDDKYVIADIDFVRSLMNYTPSEVSFVSVNVAEEKKLQETKQLIQQMLGSEYSVKDRFDQQPLYFKIFKSERLGVFLILSLIVVVASLNLISSLSLLIIDKRKDIRTLESMGASRSLIKKVFFCEGGLISVAGTVLGLVVGFVVCIVQDVFGIIKMGDNCIVDSFPVAMRLDDFVVVFVLVIFISMLSVLFAVRKSRL